MRSITAGGHMLTWLAVASPVGTLWLCAEGDQLVGLHLPDRGSPIAGDPDGSAGGAGGRASRGIDRPAPAGEPGHSDILVRAAAQLAEYFAGTRRAFDLPLAPAGTAFQCAVWRALASIPFGVTCSYGDLARVVGRPAASRAVGAANGANPIAIILPCHRVIGASGALTGYGGGLAMKRWLLAHERSAVQPALPGHALPAAPPGPRGTARR